MKYININKNHNRTKVKNAPKQKQIDLLNKKDII